MQIVLGTEKGLVLFNRIDFVNFFFLESLETQRQAYIKSLKAKPNEQCSILPERKAPG